MSPATELHESGLAGAEDQDCLYVNSLSLYVFGKSLEHVHAYVLLQIKTRLRRNDKKYYNKKIEPEEKPGKAAKDTADGGNKRGRKS